MWMFRRERKAGLSAKKLSKVKRSRWEEERRRRLIVEIVIVLTIIAALALVGYGYYDARIKPWHQTIVEVNDETFNMRYYVKMLRLWDVSGIQDMELASAVGGLIVDYELLRQVAIPEFTIEITEEEVQAKTLSFLGFNPNEQTIEDFYGRIQTALQDRGMTWSDFEEMVIRPMLIQEKMREAIGDTEYASGIPVEYVRVQAMLVTGSDNATAARAQWEAGTDFDQLVNDFSPSVSYGKTSDGTIGEWMPRGIGESTFEEFAFGEGREAKFGLVSEAVEDSEEAEKFWLIRVLGKQEMPLTEDDREVLIGNSYSEWLENEREAEENVIVNHLEGEAGYDKIYWALGHVPTT